MLLGKQLLLTALLIFVTVPSIGQETKEAAGHVTAFACVPLPSPLIVEVETFDESSHSDRLRQILLHSLTAQQAVISSDAPLRLTLHVGSVNQSVVGNMHSLNRLDDGEGFEERIWIRVDLWSNRRNSVIGGRRYQNADFADEIKIEITLDSQINGQCIWQGVVVFRLDGRDETVTAGKLIPLLVDRLGRTARAEPIKLD